MEAGSVGDGTQTSSPYAVVVTCRASYGPLHFAAHSAYLLEDAWWTRTWTDHDVVGVVFEVRVGHTSRYGRQREQAFGVCRVDDVTCKEDRLFDQQPIIPKSFCFVGNGFVVLINHVLDLGNLDDRIQVGRQVSDLNDLGKRQGASRGIGTVCALVVVVQELAKTLDVFRPVLIYANLVGVLVRLHQSAQKDLFEVHGTVEPLATGSHSGLQGDHVEVEVSGCGDPLDELAKARLGPSGEKHTEGIFLFDTKLDEVDNGFVPPAFPCAGFFLCEALTGGSEDSGVVPPAAIGKGILAGEQADGAAGP